MREPALTARARRIEHRVAPTLGKTTADLTDVARLEQAALLRGTKCSSRETVNPQLSRIDKLNGMNSKLHAFVDVYAEEARSLADAVDRARKVRRPAGLNDLCDIPRRVDTIASRMWSARVAAATCGSMRIPAAFNGPVGLNRTLGRISLHGTGLLSWMLDTIGPLKNSVDDCAELPRALAAPNARKATTSSQTPFALPNAKQFPSFMHPGALAAWTDAAKLLEKLGAQIVPVRLPDWNFDLAKQVDTIIAPEASALHRKHILPQPHDLVPAANGRRPRVPPTFEPPPSTMGQAWTARAGGNALRGGTRRVIRTRVGKLSVCRDGLLRGPGAVGAVAG